jgi:hypothetical protein
MDGPVKTWIPGQYLPVLDWVHAFHISGSSSGNYQAKYPRFSTTCLEGGKKADLHCCIPFSGRQVWNAKFGSFFNYGASLLHSQVA